MPVSCVNIFLFYAHFYEEMSFTSALHLILDDTKFVTTKEIFSIVLILLELAIDNYEIFHNLADD